MRFFLGYTLLFSCLSGFPQTPTSDSNPQLLAPKLADDVAVYVDAFHPLNKATEKCPVRAAGLIERMVRDEFANTEKGRLVGKPEDAEYALVVVAPLHKEVALLVPIASYRENVHWLNPVRGEVNIQKLFDAAVWDSAQSINMGKRYAIGYATLGAYPFAGKMKPRQFVVKLKDEMMGGAKHRTVAERALAREQRVEDRRVAAADCDLDLVFKGTPPVTDPIALPSTPVKIYFEPLSVPPKSECVRELRVRDNGTMKLEKGFEGDQRFELVKNRDGADYVFSLLMFPNKNVAMLVAREVYEQYVEWDDPGIGTVDLFQLWSSAVWRSNQANQRVKNAGVTVLTYGIVREAGNKSATDLITLFRNEFVE